MQCGASIVIADIASEDEIGFDNKMAKQQRHVGVFHCLKEAWFADNTGGGSGLKTKNEKQNVVYRAAAIRSNCHTTDLKIIQRFLQQASTTQSRQALAREAQPVRLRPHLHSARATARHALHHTLGPAPRRPVGHVHTARRSGQSLARGCNTAEHEAHWHPWRNLNEHVTKGRRKIFPMAFVHWRSPHEEPPRSLDELERALDLHQLPRRRQRMAIGAEPN
jgi:hypothetical protein